MPEADRVMEKYLSLSVEVTGVSELAGPEKHEYVGSNTALRQYFSKCCLRYTRGTKSPPNFLNNVAFIKGLQLEIFNREMGTSSPNVLVLGNFSVQLFSKFCCNQSSRTSVQI